MNSVDWPTPIRPLTEKEIGLLERIRSKIDIQENGCHMWTGYITKKNVPIMSNVCVKPILYNLYHDNLIPKNVTYSKCGNSICVNVNHLVQMKLADGMLFSKIGWDKYGKYNVEDLRKISQIKRLISRGYVDGECYRWSGHKGMDGYGKTGIHIGNKRAHQVHRAMWELTHGPIDDGLVVRHKCRNRDCYKIDHLELGTSQENAMDRERDETLKKGENASNAKISKELAQKIKDSKGEGTQLDRATRYNVSRSLISHIDYNLSWGYLPFKGKSTVEKFEKAKKQTRENRLRRLGLTPTKKDYDRMWERVCKKCIRLTPFSYNNMGCLVANHKKRNYYSTKFKSDTVLSHILVWEMFHGSYIRGASKGKHIRHMCGNRYCVEPKHLKIGTPQENEYDKRQYGTETGMPEETAKQIWELKGTLTQKEIAKKFNVGVRAVGCIHQKLSHKYLHTPGVSQ